MNSIEKYTKAGEEHVKAVKEYLKIVQQQLDTSKEAHSKFLHDGKNLFYLEDWALIIQLKYPLH